MAFTVVITNRAKKDIDTLAPALKKRLGKKLLQVVTHDDIYSLAKRLVNSDLGEYRIRVGDYRILCDIDHHNLIILRVQHRKDVYR